MVNSQPSGLNIKAEDWAQKPLGSSQRVNYPEGIGVDGIPRDSAGSLRPWAATLQRADEVRVLCEEYSVGPDS